MIHPIIFILSFILSLSIIKIIEKYLRLYFKWKEFNQQWGGLDTIQLPFHTLKFLMQTLPYKRWNSAFSGDGIDYNKARCYVIYAEENLGVYHCKTVKIKLSYIDYLKYLRFIKEDERRNKTENDIAILGQIKNIINKEKNKIDNELNENIISQKQIVDNILNNMSGQSDALESKDTTEKKYFNQYISPFKTDVVKITPVDERNYKFDVGDSELRRDIDKRQRG